MNQLARELNQDIENGNPHIIEMLSDVGKQLFFPKGILSQSAEAKEKAHKLNATIGIATEKGGIMHFPSVMSHIDDLKPEESLTYAPSFGIPALRKTWKEWQLKKNPSMRDKQTSLPVVSCGITHAISVLTDMWMNPGDVVILPDMMWGNYNLIMSVRRGIRLSHYSIFTDEGRYNIPAFEKKVREEAEKNDKIIVLLNFPHNPTGYSISEEEGNAIVNILTDIAEGGTNVIAITDDAYFGLFFEEETMKESVFARLAGSSERLVAIKMDGATKENFVWGLRVGFMTYGCKVKGDPAAVYNALERKTAGGVRGNISNASHLSQSIVLKSMNDKAFEEESREKFEILRKRAAKVKEVLADPKYNDAWDVYPFNSGYFMCVKLKTVDAEQLRVHLLDKYGVGLIALGERNLRVAFSCLEESDVQELFDTVLQGIRDLS